MRGPVASAVLIAVMTAGCGTAPLTGPGDPAALAITNLPTPYQHVTAGDVRALVPDGWSARVAGEAGDPRAGLTAAPVGRRASTQGMAALWIDLASVGVPSDYYYVAATTSLSSLLPSEARCVAARQRVLVDHAPEFASGEQGSPGDFIADGFGRCADGARTLRWGYYVVAPGFGPARSVGIPTSGLYIVVAVVRDGPQSLMMLRRILGRTEFAGARMTDFVAAAVPAA